MRLAALILSLLVLAGIVSAVASSQTLRRCRTGTAQGFVSIRTDPPYLVGTIPSAFTAAPRYFSRRYNCRRANVLVRRVDLGVYELRFPRLANRTAIVSAQTQDGASASVFPFGDVYRVVLRGPLSGAPVASLRDVPFSVALF